MNKHLINLLIRLRDKIKLNVNWTILIFLVGLISLISTLINNNRAAEVALLKSELEIQQKRVNELKENTSDAWHIKMNNLNSFYKSVIERKDDSITQKNLEIEKMMFDYNILDKHVSTYLGKYESLTRDQSLDSAYDSLLQYSTKLIQLQDTQATLLENYIHDLKKGSIHSDSMISKLYRMNKLYSNYFENSSNSIHELNKKLVRLKIALRAVISFTVLFLIFMFLPKNVIRKVMNEKKDSV